MVTEYECIRYCNACKIKTNSAITILDKMVLLCCLDCTRVTELPRIRCVPRDDD